MEIDKKKFLLEIAYQHGAKSKDAIIISKCRNKNVLDVGCAGQDRNFESKEWLHNRIRCVAREIHGVDILKSEIKKLSAMGYSIFHIDELASLNNKYEVIVMSDVIEHVNNPVSFLRTYSQCLVDDGEMIVSTPNSNRARNFIHILISNNYAINFEHTMWLCPKTFLEIIERSGLYPTEFYWLNEYNLNNRLTAVQNFIFFISSILSRLRSNFNPNFMFILKKQKKI